MSTSQLDIVSAALVLIGDKPLSDLTGPEVSATVANNIYESTYRAMLTQHRWRFAVGKKTLSRLVEAPLNHWSNAYQIPADFLMAVGVRPNTDYEIFEDKIYSNQSDLALDYIYRVDESALPAYYVKALEYELAAQFSLSITDNRTYYELMRGEAVNHWRKARFADSAQRPNRAIESSPFITARY